MATARKKRKGKKSSNRLVLIKKANDLIESRYRLDIWETRIFLSVLSQIRRTDEEFQTYRIRYGDVVKVFGLKSGDSYAYLRDGARSLMDKKFVVNYKEDGVKREKLYHILRTVDVMEAGEEKKRGAANNEYIDIVVEDMMRPMLLQLQKNFTAYDLQNVVKLGVYPIRVYELLKQYESIGHRTIRVDEMKRMFEVEDKYRMIGDFNRWVVQPAIKEINNHTDLMITDMEKLREGRRITSLKFSFRKKTELELAEMRGDDIAQLSLDLSSGTAAIPTEVEQVGERTEKDERFDRYHKDVIERFGVTPSVFLHLLDKHTEAEIEQAIRVTNRAKYHQQIKRNVAGFFVKALTDGFTDEKEESAKRKQTKAKRKVNVKELWAELANRKKAAINEKIKEITARDEKIADRAIKQLRTDPIISIFITTKEEGIGRKLTLEDFRQDKTLVDAVKAKIMELAKDDFKELLAAFDKEERKLQAAAKK